MSYFDRLLEKIDNAEARLKLTAIAQDAPELTRWIVDPEAVTRADQFDLWARDSWDTEHGMTKAEFAYQGQIADLQGQIAQGKEAMTFEELNAKIDEYAATNGLIKKADFDAAIQAKETQLTQTVNAISRIATKVPYLNQKHAAEFGEMFDPEEFLTKATESGAQNLDTFYKDFTADKRQAKQQADVDRQIAEAKEAGKREALQAQAMGQAGQMPTMDSAPEIGHFQRQFMKMATPGEGSAVPVNAELGKGIIARAAATAGDMAAFAGRVQ